MGQRVIGALAEHRSLYLSAALVRESELQRGVISWFEERGEGTAGNTRSVSPLVDVAQAVGAAKVVVDFAAPAACERLAPACVAADVPYVVASTGLSDVDEAALQAASLHVPVLSAANFSLGVNVLVSLVERAARSLPGFDAEVFEIHHRGKRDAPSGTAYALGEAVERARGEVAPIIGRGGISEPRADDELGYAALRGGDVSGEHTVFFFGGGERVELTHRATSRDIFAGGALRAAQWLLDKEPGRYQMADVLGL